MKWCWWWGINNRQISHLAMVACGGRQFCAPCRHITRHPSDAVYCDSHDAHESSRVVVVCRRCSFAQGVHPRAACPSTASASRRKGSLPSSPLRASKNIRPLHMHRPCTGQADHSRCWKVAGAGGNGGGDDHPTGMEDRGGGGGGCGAGRKVMGGGKWGKHTLVVRGGMG
jgi:hypothetical protein